MSESVSRGHPGAIWGKGADQRLTLGSNSGSSGRKLATVLLFIDMSDFVYRRQEATVPESSNTLRESLARTTSSVNCHETLVDEVASLLR